MQMAYSYTRSKFNFAQNILTVQRTGRIPFTIIFAQFFHKFNHPKVTSYWLYQCPRLTPFPPTPPPPLQILHDDCLQFFLGITVVPRDEDNKTMVMLFFWCGVGGGGGAGLGGNNLHCGLCENGKLLSFWFSFHSAIPEKFPKTSL